jgi:hypothetical protein
MPGLKASQSSSRPDERIKPWLATSGLYPALLGACEEADPQLSSDMRQTIRETLGAGEWMTIQKPWESRRDAMLDILGKAMPYTVKKGASCESNHTFRDAL